MTSFTKGKKTMLSRILVVLPMCLIVLGLAGCDAGRNMLKPDREGSMEMQDYRDALAPRLPEVEEGGSGALGGAGIPDLQPYIASGSQEMQAMPLVSVSVNQTVPLRDVLFELARQADYDIELDPNIRGSIIFTARDKPLDVVIDRISDIAGLRYKFNDGSVRIEIDNPYMKSYKVDYLNYIRTNSSSVSNDISVVQGDGTDTGSSFEASTESEADFWGELEVAMTQLLGGPTPVNLRTARDPRIVATEQNPDVEAVAPEPVEGEEGVQVTPPEAVLRVESLPIDDGEGAGAIAQASGASTSTYSINRQAGIINVYATQKQHQEVQDFLEMVRKSVTSQVLIEAKVLEVTLNDDYATGIDWRVVDALSEELVLNFLGGVGANGLSGAGPTTVGNVNTVTSPTNGATGIAVGYAGNDVQALVRAVSQFGTVRALASPRMTVINNQSAVLNVVTNRVFFELDIEITQQDGNTRTEVDSDIRNVPEGVLINVLPSINLEDRTVSLALRPTITSIVGNIPDPAVGFAVATAKTDVGDLQSNIPELNVQEIDSVIKVRSGQPIVMGGLLQDRVESNQEGIPVLSEIPMMGSLFRQNQDRVRKTELVIFLEATILDSPNDSVHDTDKDLYRTFSSDRRPFKF